MKRAIETAYYMFKDHPNLKNNKMKILIHPLLREKMHVSVDIPASNFGNMIKEY
jgi:hypothetical protein